MQQMRARVGVCGRNDHHFQDADFALARSAKIESIKMMSFTDLADFERLAEENPGIDFVIRLYDGRFGVGHHPTPAEFANTFIPIMRRVGTGGSKFEVHNEPNHLHGIEGWGQEDHHAVDFTAWFLEVFDRLKQACSWAELGFPGLAIPHRDLEWIEICRPAVERADFLCNHSYWQNPTTIDRNHLDDFWGLRFKHYHSKFPHKPIEITEFGNSNGQSNLPVIPLDIAKEYVEYYQEIFKYPYLRSASSFIMSAPQAEWGDFTWRRERGGDKPVVDMVRQMPRPKLFGEEPSIPPPPPEDPQPLPDPDPPPDLGKPVIGMARPPERITLPSGKRRDLAFCVGFGPWERGCIKVEWAYGYTVEIRPDGTGIYCGESVEIMSGEDAIAFTEYWDSRTSVM